MLVLFGAGAGALFMSRRRKGKRKALAAA
ncbi:hypothetical protein [Aurantiacibacter flavus]|uniref:LPXTG cell wall anchor domain-containing protein n=1 Tax=Aurantiacibacter flavus TaxID=3145232 RepID=A0ABV0CZT1_9SPHN